jgi:hypothetical protein
MMVSNVDVHVCIYFFNFLAIPCSFRCPFDNTAIISGGTPRYLRRIAHPNDEVHETRLIHLQK